MNNFKKLLEQESTKGNKLNEGLKEFFTKIFKKMKGDEGEKMFQYFDDGDMWDMWITFEDRVTKLVQKEIKYVVSKNKPTKDFNTSYSIGLAMSMVMKNIMGMTEVDRKDFIKGMNNGEWDV